MTYQTSILTAFLLTMIVAPAMSLAYPNGNSQPTITSALPSTISTTIDSALHHPKLSDNYPYPPTGKQIYSREYDVFIGFLAVSICLAIIFPLAVCAALYFTREREEPEEVIELAETGTTGSEGDKEVDSFPKRVWRRLRKNKAANEGVEVGEEAV